MNSSVGNQEHRSLAPDKYLFGGVVVSIVGSACCIGPFFLLATGISGAWMSRLMILDAYQPLFVSIVLLLFAMAGWRIFRPSFGAPVTGESCSMPRVRLSQKFAFFFACVVAAILLTSSYWIAVLA